MENVIAFPLIGTTRLARCWDESIIKNAFIRWHRKQATLAIEVKSLKCFYEKLLPTKADSNCGETHAACVLIRAIFLTAFYFDIINIQRLAWVSST